MEMKTGWHWEEKKYVFEQKERTEAIKISFTQCEWISHDDTKITGIKSGMHRVEFSLKLQGITFDIHSEMLCRLS